MAGARISRSREANGRIAAVIRALLGRSDPGFEEELIVRTTATSENLPVLRSAGDPLPQALHWILRIAVAACFIGHGVFGFITKEGWVPFFGVVGIDREWAYRLMPVVGTMDVACGILALFWPLRVVFLHLVFWGIWTASLRPLSGDSFWEMVERAGNYGAPLAMLVLAGRARTWREWFARVRPRDLDAPTVERLWFVLKVTAALLLIGHGALALGGKTGLLKHHAALGLSGITPFGLDSVRLSGWIEVLLGAAVLMTNWRTVFVAALAWKVGTELFFPLSGDWWWEFIERAGSYPAPLGLFLLASAPRGAEAPGSSAAVGVRTA